MCPAAWRRKAAVTEVVRRTTFLVPYRHLGHAVERAGALVLLHGRDARGTFAIKRG